ncbi:hypothetical protein DFH09DRAFT_1166471 [Mycena vulgaris]|nr:hypothetical protein DFH09DRAFT_1166471 [Mycena vulgaris]
MPRLQPPATLLEYTKRDSPRIGGSEGAFIALVVVLGLIILGSCIAIYILVRRDHSPASARHAASPESKPTSQPPWSARLFGTKPRKGGHGWIQASGDAWEADEVERTRELAGLDAPFHPPAATDSYPATPSYSSDSVTYDPLPETRYAPMAASSTLSTLHESPVRSASPESSVHPNADRDRSQAESQLRQFSVESKTSIRTFEGGTKFIEGL